MARRVDFIELDNFLAFPGLLVSSTTRLRRCLRSLFFGCFERSCPLPRMKSGDFSNETVGAVAFRRRVETPSYSRNQARAELVPAGVDHCGKRVPSPEADPKRPESRRPAVAVDAILNWQAIVAGKPKQATGESSYPQPRRLRFATGHYAAFFHEECAPKPLVGTSAT
jgi:hypothetical protein